ncbi:uncharacterized protein [Mytilus edulis]
MGQLWSNEVRCSKDEADKTAWLISDSDNVDQIIVVYEQINIFTGEEVDTELTALTIACLEHDVKLVKKLIQKGADIHLFAKGNGQKRSRNCGPPIYCAATKYNVEIIKLLIDAGVDINRFQGFRGGVNVSKSSDQHAIIGRPRREEFRCFFTDSSCPYGPGRFLKVLEQYLNAGVKLNTTSWGPCLFLGRGKVCTERSPNPLGIPEHYFFFTTAIMLLQHGVDPNLYTISDVLRQERRHQIIDRFDVNRNHNCIVRKSFVTTFLAAGYDLPISEMNHLEKYCRRWDIDFELITDFGRPPSLKHLARTLIRKHIRFVNMDTSVFPVIDKLTLPTILKDFLKLYDVSPSDMTSIICYTDSPRLRF